MARVAAPTQADKAAPLSRAQQRALACAMDQLASPRPDAADALEAMVRADPTVLVRKFATPAGAARRNRTVPALFAMLRDDRRHVVLHAQRILDAAQAGGLDVPGIELKGRGNAPGWYDGYWPGGRSMLEHEALLHANVPAVRWLLAQGACPNRFTATGAPVLVRACAAYARSYNGPRRLAALASVIEALLADPRTQVDAAGCATQIALGTQPINPLDDGDLLAYGCVPVRGSALGVLVQASQVTMPLARTLALVDALLARGAALDAPAGSVPLAHPVFLAAIQGNLDVFEHLIAKGARLDAGHLGFDLPQALRAMHAPCDHDQVGRIAQAAHLRRAAQRASQPPGSVPGPCTRADVQVL